MRPAILLAMALVVPAVSWAEDAAPAPKPKAWTLDFTAHGGYVPTTGDEGKLLEDEGNLMNHGFLLDSLRYHHVLGSGLVLDLASSVVVPASPEWTESWLDLRLRKPARWAITLGFQRTVSFFDDSIGSPVASGLYPEADLGRTLFKSYDRLSLGFVFTPCTCSRIRVALDYAWIGGEEVPLKGSVAWAGDGPVFSYPALWSDDRHTGGILVDAAWRKGGLGIAFTGSYRFGLIDDKLTAWRPLDGSSFDGTDVLGRHTFMEVASARLGLDLAPIDAIRIGSAYVFAFSHSKPASGADTFGDAYRNEFHGKAGAGAWAHRFPLGILVNPVDGLALRLHLVGGFSGGDAVRRMTALAGDPGTAFAAFTMKSGSHARFLNEALSISVDKPSWLDLGLTQRLEIEGNDLFKAMIDTLDDGIAETRVEDIALTTIRNEVGADLGFRIVRGLILEAEASFAHTWQDEKIEALVDWMPYGGVRAWNLEAKLELKYRLPRVMTLVVGGRFFTGKKWRTEASADGTGYDTMGWTIHGGVTATPASWIALHALYSYTSGDYELSPAPLLGDLVPVRYEGRIHSLASWVGITPLGWLGFDLGYQLSLVDGTVSTAVHRMSFEARFKVHGSVEIGLGYLGRIYLDEQVQDDEYGAHAIRAVISGSF